MSVDQLGRGPETASERTQPRGQPARPVLSPPQLPEIELRELFRKLWRRKGVIIGVTAILMTLAVIVVAQLTPQYTATASVMVNPRQNQVTDMESVMAGLPMDQETIQSEIEIIRSRSLSQRVVEQLELYRLPEYNPDLQEASWLKANLSPKSWLPEAWSRAIFGEKEERPLEEQASLNRSRIIATYLDKLSIQRVDRSRVIEISVTSTNSGRAQEVANTLADLYIVEQLEAKFEATKNATSWLNDRLATLRQEVEASERAVERFRASSGLTETRGATLISQQISELSTQLVMARTQRTEAESRLDQLERLVDDTEQISSLGKVLSSQLIINLRSQEAEVLREAAELSEEYGDSHPRMINMRSEIENIRSKIRDEVSRIVQDLRNDAGVARARERSLEQNVAQLETRLADMSQSDVQLRALEREAEANRALYENFLNRFKELNVQDDIQAADVRVISYADLPAGPSFPNNRMNLLAAFLGSIFAGIGVATLLERLDHGFRSTEEIERQAGIAGIGMIPAIPRTAGNPADHVLAKPFSSYAESLRSLLVSIQLSNVDSPPKVILVTSAGVGEGKTAASVSLARVVAKSGKKVVLVDCDLRRPSVHSRLGLAEQPGLVEVLAGEIALEDALRQDEPSGALVLTAGKRPTNPLDLLGSQHFADVLIKLRRAADMVILDSAPVTVVSDARVLTGAADKTVFLIRWAHTRREVVQLAIRQLREARADIAGAVLSRVNVKQHARYGYGDSGYYYGAGRKYYTG